MPVRSRAAIAGLVGVAVVLAGSELLAGIIAGVPSLVVAVGERVIEAAPGNVATWAISTLGAANKPALELGTVVVALALGALVGVAARRHRVVADGVFAVFGLLGVAAAASASGVWVGATLATSTVAVGAGVVTTRLLLRRTAPPVRTSGQAVPPAGTTTASPTDPPLDRRGFLSFAGGLVALSAAGGATGRLVLSSGSMPVDVSEVALPTPSESLAAVAPAQRLAVEGLSPVLTPNDEFFRIDTVLSPPRVAPEDWTLRIHGLVEREVELSYEELTSLPLEEFDVTLSCVSNEVGGDLVGTARWLGLRLETLLERAGVRAEAEQLVGRSVDGWTGGFPVEAAFDGRDAIVAVGMNGEPLPRRHGFPARLVVPGLYGYVSATKWLAEIEVTTWDALDGYWIPRGWSERGPVKTQSRIDVPARGARVGAGRVTVAGVAWAPTRGVTRVEVDLDDADDWQVAELSEPLSDAAWVQWRTEVDLDAGSHRLRVRATDGTGATQPPGPVPVAPDGAEGWHAITVEAVTG